MKTLNEIKAVIIKHKAEIEKIFNVDKIAIFGSWVKGEQNRKSDIDILVEFTKTPDIFQLIDLEEYLKRLLKRKVDIVRLSALRKEIKDEVLKEAIFL